MWRLIALRPITVLRWRVQAWTLKLETVCLHKQTLKPLCRGSRAIRPSTAGSMSTANPAVKMPGKDGIEGRQLVVRDGNAPFPGFFWVRKIHIMFLLRL